MRLLIDAHIFDEKFQGTRTYLKGLYSALIPIAKEWEFFFVANDIENLEINEKEREAVESTCRA